ncbi:MAG: hypothetical protein IJ624_05090 [Prevotella sp.]|nr:hypothetical protein [Prevotella sp.]
MDIKKLFSGVGVVIDDMLDDVEVNDKILDIVSSLEEAKMPLVKYKSLPDYATVCNLREVSFILLDWQLYRTLSIIDGQVVTLKVADNVIINNNRANTSFVRKLLSETSVPIFIFSNKDDVKDSLIDNGISERKLNSSPVFIKKKEELFNEAGTFRLFEELEEWVRSKSAVYVLKEWLLAFNTAKEGLLNDFSQGSQYWPGIIWDSANADSVNAADEVSSLMMQNIASRMTPVEFDAAIIKSNTDDADKEALLKVLQAQRYMRVENDAMAVVGDVYVFEPDKVDGQGMHSNPDNKEIAINIRPTCDCVFREGAPSYIYLIYGRKLTEGAQKDKFLSKYHKFEELDVEAIVGPIVDNSYYSFKFKDIEIVDFRSYKHLRQGRVVEPFISHITERYSLYIQRHALPSLPESAVCVKVPGEKLKDVQIKALQEENEQLKNAISNLKDNRDIIERKRKSLNVRVKCKSRKRR